MERALMAATIGLLMPFLASCKEDPAQPAAEEGQAAGAPVPEQPTTSAPMTPKPAQPAPVPAQQVSGSGKVLETMDSGGYTYAKLDLGGDEVWFAGPETQLAVGDVIAPPQGMLMPNFKSSTLGRTFERIYFLAGWGEQAAAGAGAAVPTSPQGGGATAGAEPEVVEPAEGGKTIAGIYADKAALVGQAVVVRGKVIKFNSGIMGRNWIHLQDGTGAAGANDLTVTTQATVSVGDVVVVRGTVAIDKDFGAGYRYDLIVEDAKIDGK